MSEFKLVTEERDPPEEPYTYIDGGHPYVSRNYWLFAMLSGVRRYDDFDELMGADFEPIAHQYPPDDLCPELADEVNDSDNHTPGWITLSEIDAAFLTMLDPSQGDVAERLMGRDVGNGILREFWDGCVELNLRPLGEQFGAENVRLVFWYDN